MAENITDLTVKVDGSTRDTPVKLGINGKTIEIPVGVETRINSAYAEALSNSGYSYSIVSPQGGADGGGDGVGAPAVVVERSGGDDTHGKAHVDKGEGPTGAYAPERGAFGADDADADAADGGAADKEPGLLDGSVDNVIAGLDGLSLAELEQLREDETKGKSRRSLLPALDAAIEAAKQTEAGA